MASRSIELILKAQVGQMVAGLKTARDAVNATSRDVAGFVRTNERDMQTFGTAMTAAGAGLTAMTVGAVKAAIDWESAWADVQKVNDGTHEQMTRLEEDLREMARTIPATHEEIAAVAEAAGRLGVEVDNVADFTRVMIDLGNTTDLTADQAATSFARFTEIMGTGTDNVDRLGSTVVELGNNFAATETEIVEMGMRLAGAGNQVGLAEAEVMALATAMSAVGIEAQMGGSAMSRVMIEIESAVNSGGESMEKFAAASGMTAEQFTQAWQDDPAMALTALVDGLANAEDQGMTTIGMVEDLGFTNERTRDTLLRLAGSGDVMAEAFEAGNSAFEENTALSDEAAIRYETAAMKIKTAWASIQDVFITAGSAIAPMVGDVAEVAGAAADAFGSLPDPVIQSVTAMSGLAGVATLGAGGLMLLAPRAVETYDAFQRLRKASGTLPGVIRGVGRAAGVAAVGFIALQGVAALVPDAFEGIGEAADFETQLRLIGEGAIDASGAFDGLFDAGVNLQNGLPWQEVDNLEGALDNATMSGLELFANFTDLDELGKRLLPGFESDRAKDTAAIENMDEALSGLANGGDFETAAAGFRSVADAAEAQGIGFEEVMDVYPEYIAAVKAAAAERGVELEGMDLYKAALGDLPPALQEVVDASDEAARQDELVGALEEVGIAADGTVESLSDYLDMLFQTGLAEQSAMQAQASYQEALDGVGAAVDQITETHGGLSEVLNSSKDGFDLTTEAGRTAQGAFLDVASSGMDMAQAMADAGESQDTIQEGLQGTYDDLISAASEFGITGDAAEELARSVLGVPDGVDIDSWMDETAKQTAEDTKAAIFQLPDDVDIDTFMSDAAYRQSVLTKAGVDDIPDSDTVQAIMTDDAFIEAVRTRAAVLDIPEEDVVDAFMSAAARGEANETEAAVLGIPDGVSLTSWMSSDGRGEAESFEGVLNRIDGRHTTSTHTHTTTQRINKLVTQQRDHPFIMDPGGYKGGRASRDFGFNKLPHLANGGRLPYTGLGTDQILGVSSLGHPVAMLDDLEWTINRRSSDKYDSVLDRINRDHPSVQHLAHLQHGGRAGQLASTAMGMAPKVSVSAPPVDSAAIGAAVSAAIRSYQPVVNIGDRQFYGKMQEVSQQFGHRF